jgi:hypothetical protein
MVDRRPRTVYWDGDLIDHDWDANRVIWDFLWRSALRAKQAKPISEDELLPPRQRGQKVLVHRTARLSQAIPGALDRLIEAVRPRGYQLLLSKEAISLRQLDSEDQLIEVGLEVIALPR